MNKYCWKYKKQKEIYHEIMVFYGFPIFTSTNLMLYIMENWHEKERRHRYNNMLFALLDNEFNKDVYKFKTRLNPSKAPPP
jgi:hypothetical protein